MDYVQRENNRLAHIYAVQARVAAAMTESYSFKLANDIRDDENLPPLYHPEVFTAAAHNLRAFARELSEIHGDYTHDDEPIVVECGLAEVIASRPHVKAVDDGKRWEIIVGCECGCKESVPFTKPDCAAECGRYMFPIGIELLDA